MNYDRVWTVMNDIQESFNQISSIDFLVYELQSAVDNNYRERIIDISHALLAFLPVYQDSFDEKFNTAWKEVVIPLHQSMKVRDKKEVNYEDICKYYNSSESSL